MSEPKRRSASSSPAAGALDPGAPRARSGRRRATDAGLEARILDAALEEFAEHGFAGARIERISSAANTVDRMLYYYYGNKERLYQAVLEQAYAQMIGAQRAFVTPEDPVAAMRQLVEHSWDHYVSHPHLVRLLMNENLLRGRHIVQSEQVGPTSFPLVETVKTVLEAGQARGVFRADAQATQVLMTIMSLGFFYLSNQHTCSSWIGVDLMTRPRRNAWRAHICDVVLDYLGAPAAGPAASPAGKAAAAPRASRKRAA
ncbi:TetR/AcrR family transcriptional regulator [Xenophilus sp. Marseille-Q4582]|uniref:TetR/AcrR family transcriptional regulator n=1 Tax=Xenophilus sp. Marseille-Q4582 TaxID=2866600 RepID=UPI001CE49EFE|nr:TetR family transcriptional regulator [Xenophilus sp. Marseille-Q4582]